MSYKETLVKEFHEFMKSERCDVSYDEIVDWFLSKIPTIIEEEKKQWKEEAVKKIEMKKLTKYRGFKLGQDEVGFNDAIREVIKLIKEL